jgi:ketosteroid isomerase-like protein
MSQENLEFARKVMNAYAEQGVDGVVVFYSEDCVIEDFPEMPDRAAVYNGPQGFRERDRNFCEIWTDLVFEPVEYIDAGDDGVVVMTAMSGAGAGSGAPLNGLAVFAWEIRNGKIVRDRAFPSRSEALKAAGLEE